MRKLPVLLLLLGLTACHNDGEGPKRRCNTPAQRKTCNELVLTHPAVCDLPDCPPPRPPRCK